MQLSRALPSFSSFVPPSTANPGFRSLQFRRCHPPLSNLLFSGGLIQEGSPFCIPKLGLGAGESSERGWAVRASGSWNGDSVPVAPLLFESPIGQFLMQILQTSPHLLQAAIDQQLDNLHMVIDGQKVQLPPSSQDHILYRRIAEVRGKEVEKALEEILYCLIVEKFVDNGISMIPKIGSASSTDPTARVDSFWPPNQGKKLESIHSPEALDMMLGHLSLVLGERPKAPHDNNVQTSKVKLGKLYAMSILYGYVIKRVDERFQLERAMKTAPPVPQPERYQSQVPPAPFSQLWDPDSLTSILPEPDDAGATFMESGDAEEVNPLRSYMMSLDVDTLQRYAAARSQEAISLIEKQTQALFGNPDIRVSKDGSLDAANDELVAITFSGLTLLVLEAVAFGSFLWDAESYVESKFHSVN